MGGVYRIILLIHIKEGTLAPDSLTVANSNRLINPILNPEPPFTMSISRHLAIMALVTASACAAPEIPPQLPGVVPAVQSWVPSQGGWDIRGATIKSASAEQDSTALAKQLADELSSLGKKSKSGEDVILLTKDQADTKHPEGYVMEINNGVTIRSASNAGLYYGTRTLLQLAKSNPLLPKGVVSDFPDYRHRMLMLDVGRKPFPMPVLKDYIRMMAWYKMNELHVHFSDEAFGGSYAAFRIQSDTFPGLASKDFSYTKKDIRELQDFAKIHGVTITPEFDMPGHARCFTNYWPDTMLKGYPNYVDVTNPKTIENLKELLDEMIPLFDGPDIHIGTDEYRVDGPRKAELHEGFRQFINTMNAHVRSHGKNCRIWSGFEHMGGTTEIDPSVVIDMWETDDAMGQINKGHKIINSNHGRTYIVPGCKYYGISRQGIYQGWEPFMVSGDAKKNPTKDNPNLLGGKLHVWCDQGPTGYTHQEIAALTLPGLHAFAEKLWGTKGSTDYSEFVKRTALTLPIPDVTLLDRIPAKKDDVVLDIPGEQTLANKDSVIPLPFAEKERGDLEYPWSLTFDALPSAAAGANRAVILSSELAEICSGSAAGATTEVVTEFADGTKRRGSVNTAGLGTTRLAGAPLGKDPFSGYLSHDVSKFSGKNLPANQWSRICVVGTEGRNTIYLNGEKIIEINNQMLCPLRWLGSKTGNSFTGKIRKLRVVNRALSAKEIGRAAGLDIPDNQAAGAATTATASDSAHGLTPENLTDGNPSTRWSSGGTSADQSVTLDLKKTSSFNTVAIDWESAVPSSYRVQVSDDAKEWRDVFTGEAKPGRAIASFPATKARHVRIAMSKPKSPWGYSIHEIEVLSMKVK
jgi:hexosaminidase